MLRSLIIVARDQPEVWKSLTNHFVGNEDVLVVLDRRQGERRQKAQTVARDRRGADRRREPRIENDLRSRHFVIARPENRTPER